MKHLLSIFCALACTLSTLAQAPTAEAVVKQFLTKVEKQTLVSDFQMTISEQATQPLSYKGAIAMRDTRFLLHMFSTEAAYDGKTLYLYSEDTNELTLSFPTQEELLEANPVLFAQALMLRAKLVFSAVNSKTDLYSIDFVPNYQAAGIQKFVLKLRKQDLLPVSIEVREGKQTTTIAFKNAKFSTSLPDFVLKKEDAYMNDMR